MKNRFNQKLALWHKSNERNLPWVGEKDPYLIWLSEIILQQTRVEQGITYFLHFKNKYPTVQKLAEANESEILKLWEGLGYNSRARNLHTTAKNIVQKFKGKFPNTYDEMIHLKGIGPYTAAAISSFAFNLPYPAIDANVLRIYSRIFGIEEEINSTASKKKIFAISKKLFPVEKPAMYNQAMMDFGALICVPKNPSCHICPFASDCFALKNDLVSIFPFKKKQKKKELRHFHYLVLHYKNQVIIEQRNNQDIWKHLFQFLLVETNTEELKFPLLSNHSIKKFLNLHLPLLTISKYKSDLIIYSQSLTHQNIQSRFYHLEIDLKKNTAIQDFILIKSTQLKDFPLPGIIRKYLQKNVYF